MKYFSVLFIALFLTLISCKTEAERKGYAIHGVAKNIQDSTQILLYLYPQTDVVIDSTLIINEEFQFTGEVSRPRLAHLRIVSSRASKTFWLENEKINIVGVKDDFSESQVKGSKTQQEAEVLVERKDSIFKEMKRLDALVTPDNRDSLFVFYEKMQDVVIDYNKEFIKDFPNSYESLTQLNWSKERLGNTETAKLFPLLSEALQMTEEGVAIKEFITKNKNLKVGDAYVDFQQANVNGETVNVSALMGKYTLIDFWASWCGPCRTFNPELIDYYKRYKGKGFEIIGVSLDSNEEKWKKAVIKDGLTWENISDLKGGDNEAAMIYGVSDIPDNFLIDEKGIIIARFIRGKELEEKLSQIFDENTSL